MISRKWHGRVPVERAEAYFDYLRRTGLRDYRSTPGNLGVLVERWVEEGEAHYLLTTFWDSLEAIQRFAGEDYGMARYYPEDDDFLLERERGVRHAEVVMALMPADTSAPAA